MDIKSLRQKLGWTQERLASELGVSLSTLRYWEYGKFKPSKMAQEKIKQFKELLKITNS